MNFNIRQAVLHNINQMNEHELVNMIKDSITQGDEKYLPGLGVLFEVIWNHSESSKRDEMIHILHEQLEQEQIQSPFA